MIVMDYIVNIPIVMAIFHHQPGNQAGNQLQRAATLRPGLPGNLPVPILLSIGDALLKLALALLVLEDLCAKSDRPTTGVELLELLLSRSV